MATACNMSMSLRLELTPKSAWLCVHAHDSTLEALSLRCQDDSSMPFCRDAQPNVKQSRQADPGSFRKPSFAANIQEIVGRGKIIQICKVLHACIPIRRQSHAPPPAT
jgi:hypothetical protein